MASMLGLEADREAWREASWEASQFADDGHEARKHDPRGGDRCISDYRINTAPNGPNGAVPFDPSNCATLAKQIRDVEHYVARRAAHEALRHERAHMLAVLKDRLFAIEVGADNVPVEEDLDESRRFDRLCLTAAIGRLRRCLAEKADETD